MWKILTNFWPVKLTQRLSAHSKKLLFIAIFYTILVSVLCLRSAKILMNIAKGYDKLGHISFHIGMVLVWFLYFKFRNLHTKTYKTLLQCVLISLIFGIFIEFSQENFTSSRTGDINDVFANIFGSIIGAGIILFVRKVYNRKHWSTTILNKKNSDILTLFFYVLFYTICI